MTVEELKVVDISAFDRRKGRIYLAIADHLGWGEDEEEHHLLCLQAKINAYLYFIESGQLKEQLPDWAGFPITIKVVAKYVPRGEGTKFHKLVAKIVEDAGVTYELEVDRSKRRAAAALPSQRRPGRAKRPGRAHVTAPAGTPRGRR